MISLLYYNWRMKLVGVSSVLESDVCLQYLNAALDIQHNHNEYLYKKLLYACHNDLANQLSSCKMPPIL